MDFPILRQLFYYIAKCLEYGAGVLLIGLGITQGLPETQPPLRLSLLDHAITTTQQHAALLTCGLVVLAALGKFGQWALKQRESPEARTIRQMVTHGLTEFRISAFPTIPDNTPQDENRVTLFRHSPCLWRPVWLPWSGWLVMAGRSGHLTRNSAVRFRAADSPQDCQGVCGRAWRGVDIRVGGPKFMLPNLKDVPHTGHWKAFVLHLAGLWNTNLPARKQYLKDRALVNNYAEATFVSPRTVWKRIRLKKPCPTSILAIFIQDRKRQAWGVLVMDSSNEHVCIDSNDKKFKNARTKLVKLLTEVDWI